MRRARSRNLLIRECDRRKVEWLETYDPRTWYLEPVSTLYTPITDLLGDTNDYLFHPTGHNGVHTSHDLRVKANTIRIIFLWLLQPFSICFCNCIQ